MHEFKEAQGGRVCGDLNFCNCLLIKYKDCVPELKEAILKRLKEIYTGITKFSRNEIITGSVAWNSDDEQII